MAEETKATEQSEVKETEQQETKEESKETKEEVKETPKESKDTTETPEDRARRLEEELKKRDKTIGDLQHRVDGLFAKVKESESSSKKERTWDDLTVNELKAYRTKARTAGDDELVDFINDKIGEKTASERIKAEADKREASYVRVNTWKETVNRLPDLKDQNSELYQETVKFIQANPKFDDLLDYPDGHARAAEIVADRLELKKLKNVDKEKKAVDDKLNKEKVKKDLGKADRKGSSQGEDESLAKLRQSAESSGSPYSREWRTYLAALEKRDKQPKEN